MAAYDRDAAVAHAFKHWDKPCEDGLIWLTGEAINVEQARTKLAAPARDGWEARFVPVPITVNGKAEFVEEAAFIRPDTLKGESLPKMAGIWAKKTIAPWAGLADCAHFLSECLNKGGVESSSLGVSELVRKLQERSDTKTLCEKVDQAGAQNVIDSGIFERGDMIGYFNINPDGDYSGARRYTHSTMYVGKFDGKGRISCHTKSRFGKEYYDDEWFLKSGSYSYTLIHIASTDKAPSATTPTRMEGWWKITYPGRVEYYKFERTGSVGYMLTEPQKSTQPISASGRGYWFERGRKLVVVWRNTGTIDRWDLSATGNAIPLTVNGKPGTGTKMF